MSVFDRIRVERPADPDVDQLRGARLREARKTSTWTEIPDDLVKRGPFLISASTDDVYRPFRGVVWQNAVAFAAANRLFFTVDAEGACTFYERHGEKWSEIVARQARASARA